MQEDQRAGEIRVRGSVESVPVTASLKIQDGFQDSYQNGFQGYRDTRDYLNTRNYNGKLLDDYVSGVTDTSKPFKYYNPESTTKAFDDDKKTKIVKYFADFDNAFEIPDHQLPDLFKSAPTTPTKPTKKAIVKKGQRIAPYLQDEKLKEITLVHQKALEELNEFATKIKTPDTPIRGSETKTKPFYESFFNFKNPLTTFNSYRSTPKTPTTKKTPTKSSYLPVAGSVTNHNANVRYRYENLPQATRLNQFIQSTEDEKLERAVRKALENMRRGRSAAGRGRLVGANPGGASVGNSPGSPLRPPGPRRPFSSGPSPVRVFNFNN